MKPHVVLLANAESTAADITTPAVDNLGHDKCAVEVRWLDTGTNPSGPIYLRGSLDDSNYYTVATLASPPDGSGAGSTLELFEGLAAVRYLKVWFDATAGHADSTMTIRLSLGG